MNTKKSYLRGAAVAALLLAGCAAPSGQRAPIYDHSYLAIGHNGAAVAVAAPPKKLVQREPDWRPQVSVVQKGDTLYSIALNFGFDYRELAQLNGIPDPSVIHPGQEIRLFPAAAAPVIKPVADSKLVEIKSQPVVGKLTYSPEAVAQIEKMQGGAPAKLDTKPVVAVAPVAPPVAAPIETEVDDGVDWALPANGSVIAGFSESANRKGVDIAGKLGQPVFASAAGKVVYSGAGLRGYGKLIIIKHNSTYLSAYAHNDKVLVKEGQSVTKGQKVAEMGNTDADRVELHFEIRRLGKPVDPEKYIAFPKS